MTKTSHKNELLNELYEEQIQISTDDSQFEDSLECGCKNHTSDSKLREGNKIFAVIVKIDKKWVCKDITCWQCSVKNIVERITEDIPIAIVEGTLKSNHDNTDYYIFDSKICDVLKV